MNGKFRNREYEYLAKQTEAWHWRMLSRSAAATIFVLALVKLICG
jgi:hypothetical protein